MARHSHGTSALTRVLQVLDAFGVETPFLRLSAIAERTGLATSSVHDIVGQLVDEGVLERMPDRSYRIGSRLWEIGNRTPGVRGLREIAAPYVQAVQSQVRQHTQLAIRSGLDTLIVERLSTKEAVVNASIVGERIPLELTSVGLMLLAHAEAGVLEDVVGRGLAPATRSGIRSESELRARVDEARTQGHAVLDGALHLESRGISVAVRGSQGVVVAALGVVVAVDSTPVRPIVELLRIAATRISEALLHSYLPDEDPRAGLGGPLRRMVTSSDRSMEYLEDRPGGNLHGSVRRTLDDTAEG